MRQFFTSRRIRGYMGIKHVAESESMRRAEFGGLRYDPLALTGHAVTIDTSLLRSYSIHLYHFYYSEMKEV